jgi:hypothetical protein
MHRWITDSLGGRAQLMSFVASRTTVAAPDSEAAARSATVPNATSWGFANTTSATRRSALVRLVLARPMRSATSTAGQHSHKSLIDSSLPTDIVIGTFVPQRVTEAEGHLQ